MAGAPESPWWRTRGEASRGERRPLTRDAIVEAAMALLDRDGLSGLSMRRLAQELGAGAASLYWHVRTKEELLSLMLDRIVGEGRPPEGRTRPLAGTGQGDGARIAPTPAPATGTRLRSRWGGSQPDPVHARARALSRGAGRGRAAPRVIAYAADMFALYVGGFAFEESMQAPPLGDAASASHRPARGLFPLAAPRTSSRRW